MSSNSPQQLEALYQKRMDQVAVLSMQSSVQASEVLAMDRLGRCMVANELWSICDRSARDALLNDEHAHVRSCARLAS